jgi:hypothetical protein
VVLVKHGLAARLRRFTALTHEPTSSKEIKRPFYDSGIVECHEHDVHHRMIQTRSCQLGIFVGFIFKWIFDVSYHV